MVSEQNDLKLPATRLVLPFMPKIFPANWSATSLASIFVVILTLATYANSFPGIFVLDDLHIVTNNPLLDDFSLQRIFLSDYWGYGENSGLYRPLTILSLACDRFFFGEASWGYHLVNVLLHVCVALLLLRLLLLLGGALPVSVLAAALFAVHPIHTEVVNVVVGRSELLVALCLLAGLCLSQLGNQKLWFLLTCVFYLLGLLSKEHAVTFLALLPLADAFTAGTFNVWRRRWPLYATLLVITGIWLAWRTWGLVHMAPPHLVMHSFAGLPLPTRVFSALALQGMYLGKLFWPAILQMDYQGHDFSAIITSPFSFVGAVLILIVAVYAVIVVKGWPRKSLFALCLVFYAVSFVPTANIFFLPGVTFAERLAYLPSVWFCSGLALLIINGMQSERFRTICTVLAILYVGALGGRLIVRNMDFSDPITLWRAEVKNDPENPAGWMSLAEVYTQDTSQDRSAEAEAAYKKLLQMPRGDIAAAQMSWADFLIRRERFAEAVVAVRRALQIRQEAHEPDVGEMWTLASLLVELKQFEEALVWLDRRREYYGNVANDQDLRGEALQGLGRFAEAAAEYSQIEIWPAGDGPLRYAFCLFQLGRHDEAVALLRQIVVNEKNPVAWNLLGVIAAQKGDWREATENFSKAVQLVPDNRYYQDNLQQARQGKPKF